MRRALKLHPDSRCEAVKGIEVTVSRREHGVLVLRYTVIARMPDLRLPPVTSPERTDGLWRHTCFEAFVQPSINTAYYEFNFAPSTQWAAYAFNSYRSGMSLLSGFNEPRIMTELSDGGFEMVVTLELGRATDLLPDSVWRVGLSAVIEDAGGGLSYWALAHPPGKPDFRHSGCFVMELPAA
jgi:hypothetical protein